MNYLKRKMSPLHQGRSRRAEWRGPGPETCRVTVSQGTSLLSSDCGSQQHELTPPLHTTGQSHTESARYIRACLVNLLPTQPQSPPVQAPATGSSQPHSRSAQATVDGDPRKAPHTTESPLKGELHLSHSCVSRAISQPAITTTAHAAKYQPEHFHLVQHVETHTTKGKGNFPSLN